MRATAASLVFLFVVTNLTGVAALRKAPASCCCSAMKSACPLKHASQCDKSCSLSAPPSHETNAVPMPNGIRDIGTQAAAAFHLALSPTSSDLARADDPATVTRSIPPELRPPRAA